MKNLWYVYKTKYHLIRYQYGSWLVWEINCDYPIRGFLKLWDAFEYVEQQFEPLQESSINRAQYPHHKDNRLEASNG